MFCCIKLFKIGVIINYQRGHRSKLQYWNILWTYSMLACSHVWLLCKEELNLQSYRSKLLKELFLNIESVYETKSWDRNTVFFIIRMWCLISVSPMLSLPLSPPLCCWSVLFLQALDSELPVIEPYFVQNPDLSDSGPGLRVTWLGHATVLVEMDGLNILTDPVFSQRASPFQFMGPKRYRGPPCTVEQVQYFLSISPYLTKFILLKQQIKYIYWLL